MLYARISMKATNLGICFTSWLDALKRPFATTPKDEFNQSPDNRRLGMNPETMRWHILAASRLLKGRAKITVGDYRQSLELAQPQDVVYMDPPYQGVCLNRDPRYISLLDFDSFTASLLRFE